MHLQWTFELTWMADPLPLGYRAIKAHAQFNRWPRLGCVTFHLWGNFWKQQWAVTIDLPTRLGGER